MWASGPPRIHTDRGALLGTAPKRSKRLFRESARHPTAFADPAGRDRSPNVAVRDGYRKLLATADGTGVGLSDHAAHPDVTRRLTDAAAAWRGGRP